MYRFSFLLLFAVSRVTVILCARDRQDLLSVPGVFNLLDSCYPQYLSLSSFVLQLLLGSDYLCLGPVSSQPHSFLQAEDIPPTQHHSIPSIPALSSEAPSMLLSAFSLSFSVAAHSSPWGLGNQLYWTQHVHSFALLSVEGWSSLWGLLSRRHPRQCRWQRKSPLCAKILWALLNVHLSPFLQISLLPFTGFYLFY